MATHTIRRHSAVAEIYLGPARRGAMASITLACRRQHRWNMVCTFPGSNCAVVTTTTTTLYLRMVNAINGPTGCVAMTRFTFVRARDVRAIFAGRFDAVVATNAIARHTDMIKRTGNGKTYTRRIVATIARRVGWNMSRSLAHRNGTVMTTGTFGWCAFKHATHVTRFARNRLMGAE